MEKPSNDLRILDRTISEYPDLPPEAVVKEDLLRLGVAFNEEALRAAAGKKSKSYFIFSFDRDPISGMEGGEHLRAPEEMALRGGARGFRRTIVSVRLNRRSPYRVQLNGGGLVLVLNGEELCGVELQEAPPYYRRSLQSGKSISEMAPTIEWGYLIYLTTFRKCQYFGWSEECRFCDINENFRQQVQTGRSYGTMKDPGEVLEALSIIDQEDVERRSKAYTITGGAISTRLQGEREADFYLRFTAAIERKFPGRWISKMAIQALQRRDLERLRDAGVQIYHPNFEVWDRRLFALLCPGKERSVGWGEWMHRVVEAADVFGPTLVIPNFVAGVEMAAPHGFSSVPEALQSTGEGLEFFMSKGIAPRFTTWCVEPLSELGRKGCGPAPLEYYAGLLRLWRETHARHRLPVPPGYGDPGVGRAVFSVSAFMDVIDPHIPVAAISPGRYSG